VVVYSRSVKGRKVVNKKRVQFRMTVVCISCGGTGWLWVIGIPQEEYRWIRYESKCPACNGDGWMTKAFDTEEEARKKYKIVELT
jgi:DnaJ-class molecular chaperone